MTGFPADPGRPIRVVIADDHPVVREGLSALLDSVPSITVAGVAGTGREAVQAAVRLRPDVLILDIQMPELSGIAAAAEITRVAPSVAVLTSSRASAAPNRWAIPGRGQGRPDPAPG